MVCLLGSCQSYLGAEDRILFVERSRIIVNVNRVIAPPKIAARPRVRFLRQHLNVDANNE